MARRIAFRHELPVYYWGQEYLGAVESYLAVPLFWIFNSSPQVLRLIPMTFYVAYILTASEVAFIAAGRRAAIFTTAIAATPPLAYTLWTTRAHTFTEASAASFLFFWGCLRLVRSERKQLAWAVACGLWAGLGMWWSYLMVIYAVPGTLVLVLDRRARRWRVWAALVVCGVIGAFPAIYRNAFTTHWATITHAAHPDASQAAAGQPDHAVPEQAWRNLKEAELPAFLGFHDARLDSYQWGLPHGIFELAVALVALLGVVIGLIHSLRRGLALESRLATLGPLLGGGLMIFIYVFSRFGFEREPRYVMPLWLGLAFAFAWSCWQLGRLNVYAGGALCVALMAFQTYHTYFVESAEDVAQWNPRAPSNIGYEALDAKLLAEGRTHLMSDYWTSERITFESREQILASDFRKDRNEEAFTVVHSDPRSCVLSTPGAEADSYVRSRGYRREVFTPEDTPGLRVTLVLACPP